MQRELDAGVRVCDTIDPRLRSAGSAQRRYHRSRATAILRAHPELRELIGPYRPTQAWIVIMVGLQLAASAWAATLSWPFLFLSAAIIGAPLALSLWALLHECSHDLAARRQVANQWLGILAGLPLIIPAASSFRKYHLMHHRHFGDPTLDGDMASPWEVRVFAGTLPGKAAWMMLNPLLICLRPLRMKGVAMADRWIVLNFIAQGVFCLGLVAVAGWGALVYCLLGNLFALGLHPLGARLVQEHVATGPDQPTASYYGIANALIFNAGFHVEHHDLMTVSWRHLPRVRTSAAEFYEGLVSHESWSRLAWDFLARPDIRLDRQNGAGSSAEE